jgi:hypothetical protein
MAPFRHSDRKDLISDLGLKLAADRWIKDGGVKRKLLMKCFSFFLGFIECLLPKIVIVVIAFLSGSFRNEWFSTSKHRKNSQDTDH